MRVVGFFYVDCGRPETETLAHRMIASVRESIEGAHVVMMTNDHTPPFRDADEVIVRPIGKQGVMESRVDHFAHFTREALFLDPDIIVQKDPWDVFKNEFDVGLTKRAGGLLVDGVDTGGTMPYNTGVTFNRNPAFWKAVHAAMQGMTYKERGWFGEQVATALVAQSGEFNVLELKCEEYNYSPDRFDEDMSSRYIAHYKGPIRKKWMLLKESQCDVY